VLLVLDKTSLDSLLATSADPSSITTRTHVHPHPEIGMDISKTPKMDAVASVHGTNMNFQKGPEITEEVTNARGSPSEAHAVSSDTTATTDLVKNSEHPPMDCCMRVMFPQVYDANPPIAKE
jgi:hypothetical protein